MSPNFSGVSMMVCGTFLFILIVDRNVCQTIVFNGLHSFFVGGIRWSGYEHVGIRCRYIACLTSLSMRCAPATDWYNFLIVTEMASWWWLWIPDGVRKKPRPIFHASYPRNSMIEYAPLPSSMISCCSVLASNWRWPLRNSYAISCQQRLWYDKAPPVNSISLFQVWELFLNLVMTSPRGSTTVLSANTCLLLSLEKLTLLWVICLAPVGILITMPGATL